MDMLLEKEALELFPKCGKKVVGLCDFALEAESVQVVLDDVVVIVSLE